MRHKEEPKDILALEKPGKSWIWVTECEGTSSWVSLALKGPTEVGRP